MENSHRSMFHRYLGWHAPALRRVWIGLGFGLLVMLALMPFLRWQIALIGGWDAAALAFLVAVWVTIRPADGARTQELAMREDETRTSARLLLVVASVISLVAIGFPLSFAESNDETQRVALISLALVTVALSWLVVNTVFTLRYADLYFGEHTAAIDFGEATTPSYRDFAYLAFTIGMTYQVSDTTLRDHTIRRTVLVHALLSYVFGVVIVAAGINLMAGLVA
jgi:uncharacterized membrane protein